MHQTVTTKALIREMDADQLQQLATEFQEVERSSGLSTEDYQLIELIRKNYQQITGTNIQNFFV